MSTAEVPHFMFSVRSEEQLAALAYALGASDVLSLPAVAEGPKTTGTVEPELVRLIKQSILQGNDPLGHIFCALRSAEERRSRGATYTPAGIVKAMIAWSQEQDQGEPERIVDVGAGSGRFLVAAGRAFANAELIASEIDPLAALIARAHLAVAGLTERSRVFLGDYRQLALPATRGRTLYIGNPPYVRHHLLEQSWKHWLAHTAKQHGLKASKLAGLHVHFFLATAQHATPGDLGVFITSAEWLDVNYGSLVRELLVQKLGVAGIHVIEPTALPFEDAATTAVITNFHIGESPPTVTLQRVDSTDELGNLSTNKYVRRERLEAAKRWTPLTRTAREWPEGFVELGELCRVHRGQVTGANNVWIADSQTENELPATVLFPTITKARELFRAGNDLTDLTILRRVIDLPVDLDVFDDNDRKAIDEYLRRARQAGVHQGYIARHRKAWYSVGLREPAPILATYMARRPPVFVRNLREARHINIAHGLYPREALSAVALSELAAYLSQRTTQSQGRTYAGGLTKFEPKEMERLIVPTPELLESGHYREMLNCL